MTPLRNSRDLLAFTEELIEYLRLERVPELADRLAQTNRHIAVSSVVNLPRTRGHMVKQYLEGIRER